MDTGLLIAWGAISRKYNRGEYIFREDEEALFYYQIEKGKIKMFNTSDEGKEFIHGVFTEGQSFGEPPLLIDEKYPASAYTLKPTIVWRLPKKQFFKILDDYKSIERTFLKLMARRVYGKTRQTNSIIYHSPRERIMALLKDYYQSHHGFVAKLLIPYTRQEIANFTGLRVETVIRTLREMDVEKTVSIVNRKLYYLHESK